MMLSMIRVKVYGSLSRGVGKELEVDGEAGRTLAELLSELGSKNREISPDNPDIIIFVNGVEAHLLGGLKYRLKDGDEVAILPAAHGGEEAPRVHVCLGSPDSEVLFSVSVKPECAGSEGLLTLIAHQVYYAYTRGEMRSRKPEVEFLLRLAATDQISEAISRCAGGLAVYVCRGEREVRITKDDLERAEAGALAVVG